MLAEEGQGKDWVDRAGPPKPPVDDEDEAVITFSYK
jgi:hypothetical protein